MATSKVVGKVSVKVYPDTSKFRRDLEKFLKRWETRERLTLKVDAEVNERALKQDALRKLREVNRQLKADGRKIQFQAEISETGMNAAIRTARKNLQRQADAWSGAHPVAFKADLDITKVDVDKASMKEVEHKLKDWARDMSPLKVGVAPELILGTSAYVAARLTYLTRPRTVEIAPVLNGTALAKVGTALAALSGGRAVWEMGDNLLETIRNLDKAVPKIGALSLGLINLAGYAMTATSNLLSLGGSLASIGPAALTLPGIFGGMAIGLAATVAVMRDFNKHFPKFAVGLGHKVDAGSWWKQLQNDMSNNFWDRFEAPMQRLITTLFPEFAAGLRSTGTALGDFWGNLAHSLTGVFDGQITRMFDGLNQSIEISATHADAFANIIAVLGRQGSASLPALARWFGDISDQFSNFLLRSERDGSLQGWIDQGVEALADLGRVVRGTTSTLAGLARAMERAGGTTLDGLADTMQHVADVVNRADFQTALTRAFRGAHKAMSEIADGAGPQLESLMKRLSNLLSTVLPTAGRTAGKALGAIFDALDQPQVGSAISGFFDHIEAAVNNLAPQMPALARALASVVDVVGVVAESISKILAPAIENLAPKVEEVAAVVGPFAELLGNVLGSSVSGLTKIISKLPPELLIAGGALLALKRGGTDASGAMALVNTKITAAKAGVTTFGGSIRTLKTDMGVMASTWATAGARTQRETERMNQAIARTKTTLKGVAKAGAGLAGVAFVASGAADQFGLASTASMALAGAMVGGVPGAVAGGAIGALMDFSHAGDDATESQRKFTAMLSDSSASFDQLVAAAGDAGDAYGNWSKDMKETTGVGDAFSDGMMGWKALLTGFDEDMNAASGSARAMQMNLLSLVNTMNRMGPAEDGWDGVTVFDKYSGNIDMQKWIGDADKFGAGVTRINEAMNRLGYSWAQWAEVSTTDTAEAQRMFHNIRDEIEYMNSDKGRIDAVGDAFNGLKGDIEGTSHAASELDAALSAVLDPQMNAAEAAIQWRDALRELNGQIKSAKDVNGFSAAADENKTSLLGLVSNLQDVITNNAAAGESQKQLTRRLIDGRQAIIDNAASTREGKKAVSEFLTEMGLTPKLVTSILRTVGVDKSIKQIRAFRKIADGLPQRLQTRLETSNFPTTKRQLRELVRLYGDQPKKVETLIEAITKGAKVSVKDVDNLLSDLTNGKWQATVDVKDDSEGKRKRAKDDLVGIDKFFARPTMEVVDHASIILNSVTDKLNNIDGRTANSYVVTHYSTVGNPNQRSNVPTNPRTSTPVVDPKVNIEAGLNSVKESFTRFTDHIRNLLLQAANKWMNQMRQNANKIDNAIQQKINKARNALANADTAAEKAAAKKRLQHLMQLVKGWKDQAKEIDKAIKKYEKVNNQLQQAKAKLASLKQEIAAYKDALKNQFEGWASILNAPMATFSSMVNHLKRRILDLQEFKDGMEELTQMGLSQTVIDQLAQAGPDALAFINSILAQGQAGVDELNDLWSQVDDLSVDTSDLLGDYQYADELQSAQDAVDSLLHTLQDLQGPINDATEALMSSIAKGAKRNRKKIVHEVNQIIKKYQHLLQMMNQATQQNTPGTNRMAVGETSKTTSTIHNDNRVFNINLSARTGKEPGLFAAAQTVKAVIASA